MQDVTAASGIHCVAEPLEALVVEAVMLRLDTPQLAQAVQSGAGQPSAGDPAAELLEAQAKLDELTDMWSSGEITRAEWLRARKPVEDRRERAERRLSASTRVNATAAWVSQAGALRAAWPGNEPRPTARRARGGDRAGGRQPDPSVDGSTRSGWT